MMLQRITVARIYSLEGRDLLGQAIDILRNEEQIQGLTVFRAIEGIGSSGEVHTSSLLDLSLELPLVIEFFDEPLKIEKAIAKLQARLGFKHIVSWAATAHVNAPRT